MRIAIPVTAEGAVDRRWGRAQRVAVVAVAERQIADWQVHEVGWDELHDAGTEGSHHARIVRWCRENEITDVIVEHMGQGMVKTLTKLGLRLHQTTLAGAQESVQALLDLLPPQAQD